MAFKDKLLWVLVALVITGTFVGGYFLGKSRVPAPEVIHVPGETQYDTAYVDKPIYKDKVIPAKVDSLGLFKYLIESHLYDYLLPDTPADTVWTQVDTMKIVKEFLVRNDYEVVLFDNEDNGKLVIHPSVQYNQLLSQIPYEFDPVTHIQYVEKKRVEPFVGAGLGFPGVGHVQAGLFTKNGLGFSGMYSRDFENKSNHYSIVVLYKF